MTSKKTSQNHKSAPAKSAAETPSEGWLKKVPTWFFIAALLLLCIVFFNKVIFGVANFWEDLIYQELPHRLFARDTLIHFSFPHWNPFTFGGMPFFAATHTGVLYPSNLLLSFLPLGRGAFWYALEISIIAHMALAGITMFFFCKYRSLSRTSSLFAAISYMLCGFFVVHIIHSLMLYILAWLPLIMLLMQRGVEKDRRQDFIYAGTILGVTIFAGHPQITFYEFLFLGAFALYLLVTVSRHKAGHAALLAAQFVIAGGIAMVLLLPAAELSKESARVTWTFQMASEGSMSFRQLISLIIPKLFGATNSTNPWREELSFWLNDAFHSGYWTFWETTFYTGLAAFVFGMVQLVNIKKSRFVLFCVVWFAVSLSIALGSNFFIYRLLFDHVPGFGTFRGPARILFTWNLLLPFLAARTLDDLRDPENRKRCLRPLLICGGLCCVLGLMVSGGLIATFIPELADNAFKTYAVKQSNTMLVLLTLGGTATLLFYRKVISHAWFKTIIVAVLCIDLFVFGINYHIVESSPVDYFSRNKQLADYLSDKNKTESFRTKMREGGAMLLDRNQGMMDRIQLMEGYNPLNLFRHTLPAGAQEQLDLFNVKYAIRVDTAAGSMGMVENPTFLPRAKMFYAARAFDNDSLVKQYMQTTAFDYRDTLLLEKLPPLRLPGGAPSAAGKASITRYENNRIDLKVETPENGLLWLSEIWYPAWKVLVDGKESAVLRADYCFRAVALEKGTHSVSFVYASKAFARGALLSLLTLAAAIGLAIFFSIKRKTKV